jgi:hypothetical protein
VGRVSTHQSLPAASEIESLSDLHSAAAGLLLGQLPNSRAISPAEVLCHSRLVTPQRGTVLTTHHHPSQPLWFVLCGQLAGSSFDQSLEEPISATSGALLNCEGLMAWRVQSDSCCLLEIDRSVLSLLLPHRCRDITHQRILGQERSRWELLAVAHAHRSNRLLGSPFLPPPLRLCVSRSPG